MRCPVRILFSCVICIIMASYASGQMKTSRATIGEDGIQRVEVVAGKKYFNPDYILLKVNVPVELKVRKDEGMATSSLVINRPDAGFDIKEYLSEDPKIISFTPVKTGKFLFSFDQQASGMIGFFEVTK